MQHDGPTRYPHVFRPIRIGPAQLRNRIFVPAHTTNYGEDNLPSARHLAYHRARAQGGVGMIVFEGIRVHRSSLGRKQGVNGYESACVAPFAAIARAVQAEGAALFGQIIHLGRHIDGNFARMAAWSSSATPWAGTAPPPHPMTGAEIAEVVAAHALTARHLLEAGLDGIEIAMGHGHLVQQFLSPAVNSRDDGYGGSEANRIRLAREVLHAVRDAVGGHMAVGIRISADEFLQGGLDLAAMRRIVAGLCAQTKVDFVNVSHSAYHGSATMSTQMADMAFASDAFHHLPRGIAAALRETGQSVPVFAACKFRSVAEAEAMLAGDDIAMVGMARAHIADPALVRKAATGAEAQTRPCIGCNQGCAGFLALSLPITCLANPAAGREAEWTDQPAAQPRRVLVVGGGPAGMEAAATAAARGHRVSLYEASPRLGGALLWTEQMPMRRDFAALIAAQIAALDRTGVRVSLNRPAAEADFADFDAVILATGAAPVAAAPPGGGAVATMEQALADPAALGSHVVVQDTLGSWAVSGVIEFLAGTGRRVTVLAPTGVPAWQMNIYSSYAWRQRLRERSVRILPLRTAVSLASEVLTVADAATGETDILTGVTALVSPTHGRPNDALLRSEHPGLRAVGDCVAARSALEAIFEGHAAARAL